LFRERYRPILLLLILFRISRCCQREWGCHTQKGSDS